MNLVAVSTSTRLGSQSLKVSHYLSNRAVSLQQSSSVLDLQELDLPIYSDQDIGEWSERLNLAKEQLNAADGFVFVTPEWNGMASVGLINLFHFLSHELAHKPVMLVGVSSGRGGSYPIIQLRELGYKNRHFVIAPESLVVNDCKNVFNDDVFDESAPDLYLKKRADYALKILVQYAGALKTVRSSGVVDFASYESGM